jgi:hypothetical protein
MTELEQIKKGEFLGIADEIPIETYHKAPGLSSTGLKEMAVAPARYKAAIAEPMEETAEMRIGTLTHIAVLEPHRFDRDTVLIEGSGNATKVKEAIAEAEQAGKVVIRKPEERSQVMGMADAILSHPRATRLLSGGKAEQSCFALDPATGVLVKCRPDYLRLKERVISDLKTTSSAYLMDLETVQRKLIHDRKNHWQSAWYLEILSALTGETWNHFAHICVGREANLYQNGKLTFPVRVVLLDDASLEKARFEYREDYKGRRLMDEYAQCLKTDQWPGFTTEIETVNLPPYAW